MTRTTALTPDILASFDVQEAASLPSIWRGAIAGRMGSPFTTEDFRYYWRDIATQSQAQPRWAATGAPGQRHAAAGRDPRPDDDPLHLGLAQPGFPAGAGGGHAAHDLSPARPATLKQFNPKYNQLQGDHAVPGDSKLEDWEDLPPALRRSVAAGQSRHADAGALGRHFAQRQPGLRRGPQVPISPDRQGRAAAAVYRPAGPDPAEQIPDPLPAVLDGKSDLQAAGLSLADLPALKPRRTRESSSSTSGPAAGDRSSPCYPQSQCQGSRLAQSAPRPAFPPRVVPGRRRRRVNRTIYGDDGQAPGQYAAGGGSPLFDPDAQKAWSEYDLARAGELLDSIGLKMDKKYALRRLPDGRLVSLLVDIQGADPSRGRGVAPDPGPLAQDRDRADDRSPFALDLEGRLLDGSTVMSLADGLANGLATPQMNPAEMTPSSRTPAAMAPLGALSGKRRGRWGCLPTCRPPMI